MRDRRSSLGFQDLRASTVAIGSYQYYVWQIVVRNAKGQNIGGGTFDTHNYPITTVQGACSDNRKTCPRLEILRGSTVISSPKPTPTAVVGEQQVLSMQQVPNSGETGPYTLSGPGWFPPTQAIKNYVLSTPGPSSAPTPVPLMITDLLGTTVTYYMIDPTQATNVQATATLTSSAETAYVTANAAFDLNAPPMSWTTVTNLPRVGLYLGDEGLSLGQPVQGMTGIAWTIEAPGAPTPLPGVTGQMNMTQALSITASPVPSGCNPAVSTSTPGPELDNALFYNGSTPAPITKTWNATDSPESYLAGQPPATPPSTCTTFARSDAFVDTLMFQSSKANSIWTPIMQLSWKWSGTADFGLPGGWTLGVNSGAGTPVGAPSYQFPQWTGIFVNQ